MKLPVQYVSPKEALSVIQSGNRVFVQGSAHTPTYMLRHLAEEAPRLRDVEVVSITLYGDVYLNKPEYKDSFRINSLFVSEPIRHSVNDGHADYVPVFLSEIAELFKRNILPLDVAILTVSPPDEHGYCSLGVSVDIIKSAINASRIVIAQINPAMPRTHGDGFIHIRQIDFLVEVNQALPEVSYSKEMTPVDLQIARHCASVIEDGSTLQMGIGCVPDAVLHELRNHKDLGIHTEMFSDGVIDLLETIEADTVAEMEYLLGRPINLESDNRFNQEQYDILLD